MEETILKKLSEMDVKLDKLDSMDRKLEQSLKSMEKLKAENNELRKQIKKQEERIDILERECMKKKVVIYGMKEGGEESETELDTKIIQTMKLLSIELQGQDIVDARRLGKREHGRERPVQIEVKTMRIRNNILREKKKLKEVHADIWIEEAFPKKVMEQRRELIKYVKEKRAKGKKAYVKYNKVVMSEGVYSMETLKVMENRQTPQTSKSSARTYSQRSPEEEGYDETEKGRTFGRNTKLAKN